MARRRRLFLLLLTSVLWGFFLPRLARADQPGSHTTPIAVLTLDSEDSEEQAEALTGALRSRIRASQGWSLVETSQSLGMLTAALRCGPRPNEECQKRIGEQIKAERYLWGFVTKAGPGQVSAEVHLYQKNRPDAVARETYADALKDGNEDSLRKIAQHVVDQLAASAFGVVMIKATDITGDVVVDGEKRVPIKNGSVRLELGPGPHAIELSAQGVPTSKRTVNVQPGEQTVLDLGAVAAAESTPFPTRKVLAGGAFAAGLGFGILAYTQAVLHSELQDRVDGQSALVSDTGGKRIPASEATGSNAEEVKRLNRKAVLASVVGVSAGVVSVLCLGAGTYLLVSDLRADDGAVAKRRTRVAPMVGVDTAGFLLTGSF